MPSPRPVDPEITEEMLIAAMDAVGRHNRGRPHPLTNAEMRDALEAAYRVRTCCNPVPGLVESRQAISDALESGKV